MKKNRTYSLTAKERKQKRRATAGIDETATQDAPRSPAEVRAEQERSMIDSRKRSRSSAIIVCAVVALAIVLILVGLLVPVISFIINPYRNYEKVIARFNLSNGMTLEFVIEEEEYDIAATNFIFLAKTGYFDNTVFFDAQKGWLRFGGYEDQPRNTGSSTDYANTKHHSNNKSFCEAFSALPTDRFRDDNVSYKFIYKLNADSKGTNIELLKNIGVLAFLYSDTSTEFQMAYQYDATNDTPQKDSTGSISTKNELKPTMVGYALDGPDGTTVNNLIAIAATAAEVSEVTYGYMWKPPVPNIYIESVKVYNLDGEKWNNFDFIDYMMDNGTSGSRRVNYWTGLKTT